MTESATQLMLRTPVVESVEAFLPALEQALAAVPVAAVIIRVAAKDERGQLNSAKPLIAAVQAAGAAALLEGLDDLVGKAGADGVHAPGLAEAEEALPRFKPEKIVGVGGLRLRDDAMTVGEQDADYLLFGEPGKDGALPPAESTVERVAWWAEIFHLPCVGYAAELDHVAALASSGADFVLLDDAVWSNAAGPAKAVQQAALALKTGNE